MSEINENSCQQTQLLHHFGSLIEDFNKSLTEDINYIVKEYCKNDKPDFNNMINDIARTVKFKVNTISNFYPHIINGCADIIKEKNNLQEVNNRLLTRLKDKKITTKSTICVSTQTEELHPELVNSPLTHNSSLLNNKFNENSNSLNSPVNANSTLLDASISATNQKLCKIIIYNINENIDIPDITLAISSKVQDEIPELNFIRRVERKSSKKYNYIIEVPHHVACQLINARNFIINDCVCHVKKFIKIIRCFKCHQYGHLAKFCTKIKICGWCGESHESEKCSKPPQCTNCVHNNNTYNHSFNTNHPAFSKSCSSFKFYILRARLRAQSRFSELSFTLSQDSSFFT